MAMSPSRPDPASPSEVAAATFSVGRRGFDTSEVRDLLRMVAAEMARLQERERYLERELRAAQRTNAAPAVAIDEELVTKLLGEEAASVLRTAREGAAQIKSRAEEGAARLLREATDEAQRVREEAAVEASRRRADAAADAEAEIEMAKQQGREMVNEARAYRERVLSELARRRELARQQIEQLVHGRERLLQAFERARIVAIDVMAELTPLGQPAEFVNLSPTTGPIPLMIPAEPVADATRVLRRPDEPVFDTPQPEAVVEVEPEPVVVAEPVVEDVVVDEESVVEDEPVVEDVVVEEPLVEEPVVDAPVVEELTATDESDEIDEDDDEAFEVVGTIEVTATDGSVETYTVEATIDDEHHLQDVTPLRVDIPRAIDADDEADDREPAPVVSIFRDSRPAEADDAVEADDELDVEPPSALEPDVARAVRSSVDELFAKLRASTAGDVARKAAGATTATTAIVTATIDDAPAPVDAPVAADEPAPADSVFLATPPEPVVAAAPADSPFARRDEALTPIIVAAARRLKRVLADEQNDVLHVLRKADKVRDVTALVPGATEHAGRYAEAVTADLLEAALAGAVSMGVDPSDVRRRFTSDDITASAREVLRTELIDPLRERLTRAVADADGDNGELSNLVRTVYREWKNQKIDEQLDDIVRMAFGRGALAAATPGAPVRWVVDPNGPPCSDAEDNSLGGIVPAGQPFPTEHTCAPAHPGCRCMVVPAG